MDPVTGCTQAPILQEAINRATSIPSSHSLQGQDWRAQGTRSQERVQQLVCNAYMQIPSPVLPPQRSPVGSVAVQRAQMYSSAFQAPQRGSGPTKHPPISQTGAWMSPCCSTHWDCEDLVQLHLTTPCLKPEATHGFRLS